MTFPTIPTTGNGRLLSQNQNNTTAARTFPSLSSLTKNAGDLLVAIVVAYQRSAAGATFGSWGGGFTELADVDGGATTMAVGIATKVSDGTETGTFTVTQAATVTGHAALFLMSIENGHGTTLPELTALAVGTAAAADPAALDPAGWGSEDTLWIAVGGNGETSGTGSWTGMGTPTAPTNYNNANSPGLGSDVIGGIHGAVAFRQLNASSEDAGTWGGQDLSNARNGALLIAVRPAADPIPRQVDDPLGLTDAVALDLTATPADTENLSDAPVATNRSGTLTDTLGLTDSVQADLGGAQDFIRTVNDTEGLTDTRALDVGRGLTDALGLTDGPIAVSLDEQLTDPLGLTDVVQVTFSGATTRQIDDALGLTDTTAPATAFARSNSDNLGLTDAVTPELFAGFARQADDTLGLTDAVAAAVTYDRTVADTEGLTDARTVEAAFTRPQDDTLGLTDIRAVEAAHARDINDTEGLTDDASAQLMAAGTRQVDDLLGLSDTVSVVGPIVLADTLGLTDVATRTAGFERPVTDALGLSDARAVVSENARTVDDTLGLADTAATVGDYIRAPADTLSLSDTPVLALTAARAQADLLGLTDSLAVVVFGIGTRQVDDLLGLSDSLTAVLGLITIPGRGRVTVTANGSAVSRPKRSEVNLR